MGRSLSFTEIDIAARAAHEVNRAWSLGLGDSTHKPYDDISTDDKVVLHNAVVGIITHDHTAKQSHDAWVALKRAQGWQFGTHKDVAKQEHSCLVDFDALPTEMQYKDELFIKTVKNIVEQLWRLPQ